MVRPVPRGLARARQDRRRARRRPQARQGEHRRGAGARDALRRPVDPDDDPLQGRGADGRGRGRPPENVAREGARALGVSGLSGGGRQALSAISFSLCGTGETARSVGSFTRLSTRIPCTKTTAPPSQPPSVRKPKPISVRAYAPALTFACVYAPCPDSAASPKKTVAVTIENMWYVAVHHTSLRHEIVSQSAKPASA